jgi:DNA-binding CsgD family transcriptional regulator
MAIRPLTDAEERVARLVAAGRTDVEVASALGLTAAAVAALRSQVARKLGASSPPEVADALGPTRAITASNDGGRPRA